MTVGQWGVKSYEGDGAADALEAAFDRVHGAAYDDLMDDRNPITFDQVQQQLANPETLAAALGALEAEFGTDLDAWDEDERLAFAGVVVRHAEAGVAIPEAWRARALDWLDGESIDWEEATARRLRRHKEIALLKRSGPGAEGRP